MVSCGAIFHWTHRTERHPAASRQAPSPRRFRESERLAALCTSTSIAHRPHQPNPCTWVALLSAALHGAEVIALFMGRRAMPSLARRSPHMGRGDVLTSCSLLLTSCSLLPYCQILTTCHLFITTLLPITYYLPLATCPFLLATYHMRYILHAASQVQLAIRHFPLATCYLPIATNYPLLITHYQHLILSTQLLSL